MIAILQFVNVICYLQQCQWTWRAWCKVKSGGETQILYDITFMWNI